VTVDPSPATFSRIEPVWDADPAPVFDILAELCFLQVSILLVG
jgi:hypothetical protein